MAKSTKKESREVNDLIARIENSFYSDEQKDEAIAQANTCLVLLTGIFPTIGIANFSKETETLKETLKKIGLRQVTNTDQRNKALGILQDTARSEPKTRIKAGIDILVYINTVFKRHPNKIKNALSSLTDLKIDKTDFETCKIVAKKAQAYLIAHSNAADKIKLIRPRFIIQSIAAGSTVGGGIGYFLGPLGVPIGTAAGALVGAIIGLVFSVVYGYQQQHEIKKAVNLSFQDYSTQKTSWNKVCFWRKDLVREDFKQNANIVNAIDSLVTEIVPPRGK